MDARCDWSLSRGSKFVTKCVRGAAAAKLIYIFVGYVGANDYV